MNSLRDEDLISKYQNLGDVQSFELLVERYVEKTFSFFKHMTRNREDAHDLAQDVLLHVIKAVNGGKQIRNFANFHFKICRNLSYDFLRKKRISRRFLSLSEEESQLQANHRTYLGWTLHPDQVSCDVLENAITRCLAGIQQGQKRNIISDHLYGYSLREISRRNGCTESMAAGYWHRTKDKIYTQLAVYINQTC